jgi:hypothetical protein
MNIGTTSAIAANALPSQVLTLFASMTRRLHARQWNRPVSTFSLDARLDLTNSYCKSGPFRPEESTLSLSMLFSRKSKLCALQKTRVLHFQHLTNSWSLFKTALLFYVSSLSKLSAKKARLFHRVKSSYLKSFRVLGFGDFGVPKREEDPEPPGGRRSGAGGDCLRKSLGGGNR